MIKKNIKLVLIANILFSTLLFSQSPKPVWSDEFNGNGLDLNKWTVQTGDGCDIGICGWGNNEQQYYTADNITVKKGILSITAKKEDVGGKAYTSGRIRSKGKADFTFGRFEARIKLVEGQGFWPAFWMLSTNEPYGGWPQSGEIDILELVGNMPAQAVGSIQYGNPWPGNLYMNGTYDLHSGVFADDFHVFKLEWEPGVLRWFVDDVLYRTITPDDIAPHHWPFDETNSFHFLLNLAVGGYWPGYPDETSVFPTTMEVDWVRVYNDNAPYITGNREVEYMAQEEVYSIGQTAEESFYLWKVPPGATIVSGQFTNSITVNWGEIGGDIKCYVIEKPGGLKDYTINVEVGYQYLPEFSFENFDDEANVDLVWHSGYYLNEVSNPDPAGVNTTALVGEYARLWDAQYDVLIYSTSAIPDASLYKTGEKKLFIDVYTNAPIGTEILLQFENSSLTPSGYPWGRHSRYQTFTTTQNQWDRLELGYLDSPDPGTPDNSIDQMVLLFRPNSWTGDIYYFDNLDSYAAVIPGAIKSADDAESSNTLNIYPNPANNVINIDVNGTAYTEFRIVALNGQLLQTYSATSNDVIVVDLTELSAGVYILQAIADERVEVRRIVKK